MKYCNRCKVKVDTPRTHCPLCFRELKEINEGESDTKVKMFAERTKNENFSSNTSFLLKFFIFLSICCITVCVLINSLFNRELPWSMLVIACIVYIWVLIAHTILSRRFVFEKLLFQIIALLFVLGASENISQDKFWLQSYVFPCIVICVEFVVLMITFIRKDKSWLLSFVAISILMLIASIINFIYFDKFHNLSIISITICALSTLGYFIFGFKILKQEFSKKFHL